MGGRPRSRPEQASGAKARTSLLTPHRMRLPPRRFGSDPGQIVNSLLRLPGYICWPSFARPATGSPWSRS
eukprot:3313388-Alexandrium_andersonii.AAC.1